MLHQEKGGAEWIWTLFKGLTGETVTVGQAMVDPVHPGACQQRAGRPQQSFLGLELHLCSLAHGRTATAAFTALMESTGATIYSACSGYHGEPLYNFLR